MTISVSIIPSITINMTSNNITNPIMTNNPGNKSHSNKPSKKVNTSVSKSVPKINYALTTTQEHSKFLRDQIQSLIANTSSIENGALINGCQGLCYKDAKGIVSYNIVASDLLTSPLLKKYNSKVPTNILNKNTVALARRLTLYFSRIILLYKLNEIYSTKTPITTFVAAGIDDLFREAYIKEYNWVNFLQLLGEHNFESILDNLDITQDNNNVAITNPLLVTFERHLEYLLNDGFSLFKILYKNYKRNLDLIIASISAYDAPDFWGAYHHLRDHHISDNINPLFGEPLDSHFYLEMLRTHLDNKNSKLSLESHALLKPFPKFTAEEGAQVIGYLSEQITMLVLAHIFVGKNYLSYQQVRAVLPISKLINKKYSDFFGAPISKTTYSSLITYLNDVTISLMNLLSMVDVTKVPSDLVFKAPDPS